METNAPPYRLATYGKEYKKKGVCPSCNKKNTFVPILWSNNDLDYSFGRCDRQEKCGYTVFPNKEEISARLGGSFVPQKRKFTPLPKKEPQIDRYKAGIAMGEVAFTEWKKTSEFHESLIEKFGDRAKSVLDAYRVSYCPKQQMVVFPLINLERKPLNAKYMKYSIEKGKQPKRWKGEGASFQWWHSLHKKEMAKCLFGEHLLTYKCEAVGIVESEKTAVIAAASGLYPNTVFLATGGLQQWSEFSHIKNHLEGKKIMIFPDGGANAFMTWQAMKKHFLFDLYLENVDFHGNLADEDDLADRIWRDYNPTPEPTHEPEPIPQIIAPEPEPVHDSDFKAWANKLVETIRRRWGIYKCLMEFDFRTDGDWQKLCDFLKKEFVIMLSVDKKKLTILTHKNWNGRVNYDFEGFSESFRKLESTFELAPIKKQESQILDFEIGKKQLLDAMQDSAPFFELTFEDSALAGEVINEAIELGYEYYFDAKKKAYIFEKKQGVSL